MLNSDSTKSCDGKITHKWLHPRISSVWAVASIAIPVAVVNALPLLAIDLAYQISIDDWNKAPTPQLKLKDIKTSV